MHQNDFSLEVSERQDHRVTIKHPPSKRRRSRAIRDLIVLAGISLAVYLVLLMTDLDVFERGIAFIQQHESGGLDEILGAGLVLVVGLGIFALRRYQEALHDQTRRGEMEQRLAHEHALLHTVIDALPDYIFAKDAEGRFILSNQAHARAVNAPTADALVGKTALDFFPAELATQFDADDRAIMESGQPLISQERQTVNADGSRIWVSTTKVPLRDKQGAVTGLVGVSRDVTQRKQAEEAMRESEERYRLVARATNDAIWDWNLVSDQVRWSDSFQALFGYGEDVAQHPSGWWLDRIHPDDRERIETGIQAVLKFGATYWSDEYRLRCANGRYAAIVDRGFVQRDEDGRPLRMIGSMMDVTERKEAEERLRESEERFRAMVEASPLGIYLTDAEGNSIYTNYVYQQIAGLSASDAMADGWRNILHPEDRDRVLAEWAQAVRQRAAYESIYRILRHDGTLVWLHTKAIFMDNQNTGFGYLGTVDDITERRLAEERLRESEERFRRIVEAASEGICMTDQDVRITFANRRLAEMLGYDEVELVGKSLQDLMHEDAAASGDRWDYRLIRKDGSTIWAIISAAPFLDDTGLVTDVLLMLTDISERKQAEERLRESEERFRATFEQAAVGLSQSDMDGHYIRINQKFCDITGYTREEMLARTWMEITHPDDLDADANHLRRLLAGEIPTYSIEKRYIRKNGDLIWVNLTISLVRTLEGEPDYTVAVIEDISERKRAEEALRESEERFRQLAENMHQAIWLRDVESNATLYINPAYPEVFGDIRDNLFLGSERFRTVVHPDDLAAVEADRVAHHLGGSDHENRILRDDGSVRWLRVRTFPVHDAHGNPYRVVGMAEDITERKQAEAQQAELAAERARMKVVEQFVQSASHDLRTPLTIMQTSAYLLAKSNEPERRQRHLDNLEEQIAHITRVLQDFLDLSRLDQVTTDLEIEPCDVSALVQIIGEEQQPLAQRKQHHVQLNLAPDLPPILGDKKELGRAFRHLIVNALSYTPEGGHISIATFRQDDCAVVEMRDNGIGISHAELPFIFERFYRADKARNTDTGASGLGLTITRKIVEAHHGKIEVESAPGQGSTFRILLPIPNF